MTPPGIPFPTLPQDFFQRRMVAERSASAHTIASYRDTFELLLRYLERRAVRAASALALQDLDAPVILAFLDHLETARRCGPRTRKLRLTAICSFMRCASMRDPASLPVAQRVLAIAGKRFDRRSSAFFSARRFKRCSMRPTAPPGACSAMRRCSPCCTTPGRASPR